MNIYVHKDGTQYGPYTLEQLQEYIQQGSFTMEDQACHDGHNWVTIAQVPGISQSAATPLHSQLNLRHKQTVHPGSKKKTTTVQRQNKPLSLPQNLDNKRLKTSRLKGVDHFWWNRWTGYFIGGAYRFAIFFLVMMKQR